MLPLTPTADLLSSSSPCTVACGATGTLVVCPESGAVCVAGQAITVDCKHNSTGLGLGLGLERNNGCDNCNRRYFEESRGTKKVCTSSSCAGASSPTTIIPVPASTTTSATSTTATAVTETAAATTVGKWRPLVQLKNFSVSAVACGTTHVVAIVRGSGRVITWVSLCFCS
jgi:hypothetical protein